MSIEILDLSVELAHGMVRYPSPYLPAVSITPAATHEIEKRSAQIVTYGTHVSTHIDAPFHAIPDGKTVDQIPVAQLSGTARVIHIPGRNRSTPLDQADFEAISNLPDAEKLLIDTSWAEATWGTKEYFTEGAYLTRAAAHYLASLPQLHLIGMDFPNIDAPEETVMGTPAPNHQILLARDIVLLENLLKLDQLPDEVFLVAAPPKLVGGDGCPCRAIAMFPTPALLDR